MWRKGWREDGGENEPGKRAEDWIEAREWRKNEGGGWREERRVKRRREGKRLTKEKMDE